MSMRRSLPPLAALRAFEAAGRRLSFRGAADELGVTATAISHQAQGYSDVPGLSGTEQLDGWKRVTSAGSCPLTVSFSGMAACAIGMKLSDKANAAAC